MSLPVMKSPGVFITEVDLSTYAAVMNSSKIFGIVTLAQNGPINTIVEITSVSEFEKTFGNPISAGGMACVAYLNQASSLKVVRVAGSSATKRSVTLAGKKTGSTAVTSALVISAKYKGTLYSDALTAVVTTIPDGTADQFHLVIYKGEDSDDPIIDQDFTIVESQATTDVPYIISYESDDFDFSLGTTETLVSIDATTGTTFSVGDNGTTFTDDEIKAAIDVFDDSENIDLDILAAPGIVTAAAIARLVTVATNRTDTVAIIDPPMGLTPSECADFVNGESTEYPIAKLDSTYAACWYPWGKMYNEYSAAYEWMPPSAGVIAGMAKEYTTYDGWVAPAGIPRMAVTIFSQMERPLTRADRDILYESNINPLCNYKSQGLTAFGQKTLQRSLTATNRLNVRFLVNYIKKLADYSTTAFLFNNIDEETFDSWTQVISKQLDNILNRGGLYDYKVTMDWTTVTDEYLNNNIMPGIIQIKPTKTAEFIPIDVVIRNKSDDFE